MIAQETDGTSPEIGKFASELIGSPCTVRREIIFAGDGEMNTEKLFGKKNRIIAAAIAAGIALIIAGGVLSSKENSGVDDGKSAIAREARI